MHLEFLIEDASGAILLEALLAKLLGPQGDPHTWRVHSYKGIGRIPKGLGKAGDPSRRILLDQMPLLLSGYGKTFGTDAVVVIMDTDRRDCRELLGELKGVLANCNPAPKTLFRLAIEEVEAWLLGDRSALLQAYPRARAEVLDRYQQDSICGTRETLADAVYPGGSAAIKQAGWPLPGQVKCEWAERIAPLMVPQANVSPSFRKLADGIARLTA